MMMNIPQKFIPTTVGMNYHGYTHQKPNAAKRCGITA